MAKKARAKSKRKPTLADVVQVSSLQAARIRELERRVNRVKELEVRVQRLEDGHNGDPQAHAALAPEPPAEQPASDAAEPAGEPEAEAV